MTQADYEKDKAEKARREARRLKELEFEELMLDSFIAFFKGEAFLDVQPRSSGTGFAVYWKRP